MNAVSEKAFIPIPPEHFRFRVSNSPDVDEFLRVGQRCAYELRSAMSSLGKNLEDCRQVLDFGCGPGRVLRWLANTRPYLYGTDVDAETIAWCRHHMPGMTFVTNNTIPPLEFDSSKFDFIYAISVFSHLNEEYAINWLQELRRVAEPDCILAISICGPPIYLATGSEVAELHNRGRIFKQHGYWKNLFPDWYGDMYYDETGARRIFGRYLEFISYIPAGINGHQDLVLLRKAN
jgi:SAM-dependent methyltransferase